MSVERVPQNVYWTNDGSRAEFEARICRRISVQGGFLAERNSRRYCVFRSVFDAYSDDGRRSNYFIFSKSPKASLLA